MTTLRTDSAGTEAAAPGRYFVQSLARGLDVIRAFDADAPVLTVSHIAERTGMTRAAARRFVLTLVDIGYLQTDGRLVRPTPRLLELGYSYLSGLSAPQIALPHLERLVTEVEEASEMSVLHEDEIVYVLRVPAPHILTVAINVGARMPASATSMGRVLLAGLPDDELEAYLRRVKLEKFQPRTITSRAKLRAAILEARKRGYSLVDQELEPGLVAVAAPIKDRSGQVIAAVNLSTHVARREARVLETELLPKLLSTVQAIEADLHVAPA